MQRARLSGSTTGPRGARVLSELETLEAQKDLFDRDRRVAER
jgi:hypothetical protein